MRAGKQRLTLNIAPSNTQPQNTASPSACPSDGLALSPIPPSRPLRIVFFSSFFGLTLRIPLDNAQVRGRRTLAQPGRMGEAAHVMRVMLAAHVMRVMLAARRVCGSSAGSDGGRVEDLVRAAAAPSVA